MPSKSPIIDYALDVRVRFPGVGREFSPRHHTQTGFQGCTSFCVTYTRGFFLGDRRPDRETEHVFHLVLGSRILNFTFTVSQSIYCLFCTGPLPCFTVKAYWTVGIWLPVRKGLFLCHRAWPCIEMAPDPFREQTAAGEWSSPFDLHVLPGKREQSFTST
jgi:hypothetical protein